MTQNRALILDDNPLVREAILKTARGCGYEAAAAAAPQEFYTKFETWHPTALVLDVVLGEEDVCEVLDFLGARNFSGPLILTSGYNYRILHSVAKLARDRGLHVVDLVEKSGSSGRLVEVLRAHAVHPAAASESRT